MLQDRSSKRDWRQGKPATRLVLEHKRVQHSPKHKIEQQTHKMRKWACSDLCKFFFFTTVSTPETAEKFKPTNFHRKYELWQLRFIGKIANLFLNNMQAQYLLLIKFYRRKPVKVDLALAVWSFMMLVNRQWPSCCFIACLQSVRLLYNVLNSSHMQSATRQVHLDSLACFQQLFLVPSLIWNLTRKRVELC